MEKVVMPLGRGLIRLALMDKTGWRLKYLNESGLITDEEMGNLNAQLGSRASLNRDTASQ